MVTKTLETVVLPILESASFAHDIIGGGNTVKFDFNVPLHSFHWRIVDHTKPQVLSIEVGDLVSIAPDTHGILERVNERTEDCFGKFSLVNMETLKYCLELPYTEETSPAAFQHALLLALDIVATAYGGWLRASKQYHWDKGLFEKIKQAFG